MGMPDMNTIMEANSPAQFEWNVIIKKENPINFKQ